MGGEGERSEDDMRSQRGASGDDHLTYGRILSLIQRRA
jgi:hypothetical protein